MAHIIEEFKQISNGCEDILHTVIGNYLEGLPSLVDSGWTYKLLGMDHYAFSSSIINRYFNTNSSLHGFGTTLGNSVKLSFNVSTHYYLFLSVSRIPLLLPSTGSDANSQNDTNLILIPSPSGPLSLSDLPLHSI